jgi:hypothetical protein
MNVAGGGINIAQRIMDCGDGGHILLSQSVADTLLQLSHWKDAVQDLGECEVKHGLRLRIFNLSTAEFGNLSLPRKLQQASKAGDAGSSSRCLRSAVSQHILRSALWSGWRCRSPPPPSPKPQRKQRRRNCGKGWPRCWL